MARRIVDSISVEDVGQSFARQLGTLENFTQDQFSINLFDELNSFFEKASFITSQQRLRRSNV